MSEGTEFYTPEEDVVETLPDGRTILAAPKGVPIPLHEARRRGFVKDQGIVGPQETKVELEPRDLTEGETPEEGQLPEGSTATTGERLDPTVEFEPAPAFEEQVNQEPVPKGKAKK